MIASSKGKNAARSSSSQSCEIGELLRERRLEKGLSQKEVAKHLGYKNAQYISDWERGYSGIPMNKLLEVARLLDIPQERLFDLFMEFSINRLTQDMRSEYELLKKKHG